MAKIVSNPDAGFYEVADKPNEEELRAYYQKEYYQNENASYAHRYSEEELAFKNHKIAVKAAVAQQYLPEKDTYSLLDIGCGEGFVLQAFQQMGWTIQGLDYSKFGCSSHNPQVADQVLEGNIYDNIDQLIADMREINNR